MKYIAIFLVIPAFLILLSGCTMHDFSLGNVHYTTNTAGGPGHGVDIISFTTETPTLLPKEEGKFEVKIKNTGSVKATRGFAELLGLDQSWSRTGKEILPNEEDCKYTNGGKITLLPTNPQTGSLGGEYVCTWDYKAPSPNIGKMDYDAIVRVYYNYSSTSVSTLTIVPKEEMKNFIANGGTLKSDIVSRTNSPIRLTLTPKSPIKIYPGGNLQFPVEIKIENIGGGTVCPSIEKCKKAQPGGNIWNDIVLEFEFPDDISNLDCPDGKTIHLPNGNSQTIGCNLKITGDVDSVTQKYITIKSEYGYFVDKTLKVIVSSEI